MYNELEKELNKTRTENGAGAYSTTGSYVLDLFSSAGAMRSLDDNKIAYTFHRAVLEDRALALKTMFYTRDIRGGLGERRAFRVMLKTLALNHPELVVKNLENIATYGRYDDLLALLHTECEGEMAQLVKRVLNEDLQSETPSLLAKWLPSINASAYRTKLNGKRMARLLCMNEKEYRQTLTTLRAKIRIIENNLREKDYTFDYDKQTAGSLFKYRLAFARNDKARYDEFLRKVAEGKSTLKASNLFPYQVVRRCVNGADENERKVLNATWDDMQKNIEVNENAIAVIDTSGSMFWNVMSEGLRPIDVAVSLGLTFAQNNKGEFANSFITFSSTPSLVKVRGKDIYEKVQSVVEDCIVANTNVNAVFALILKTALKYNIKQEDMPSSIYLVSDMEFDSCVHNADLSNFENAKKMFEKNGYVLPKIVFWNVASRHLSQPVTQNEEGVVLLSGASVNPFKFDVEKPKTPYECMLDVLQSERYDLVCA